MRDLPRGHSLTPLSNACLLYTLYDKMNPMNANRVFAGVDLSGGRRGPMVALLSPRLEVVSLNRRSLPEAIDEIASYAEITVAIGCPLRPMAAAVEEDPAADGASNARGVKRVRAADAQIARRGIPVRRIPPLESDAPAWMQSGFELARELFARGFTGGKGPWEAQRVLLETHPLASAAVLLGRLPYARESLEGRIQRQLVLLRERVALPDPMDALEELTAHHILLGRTDLPGILEAGKMDALLAAFTAARAHTKPDAVAWLGDDSDGWICLPGRELLEKYKKYTDATEKPRITPSLS
jgi:predicted nuclease with RNAse H fold